MNTYRVFYYQIHEGEEVLLSTNLSDVRPPLGKPDCNGQRIYREVFPINTSFEADWQLPENYTFGPTEPLNYEFLELFACYRNERVEKQIKAYQAQREAQFENPNSFRRCFYLSHSGSGIVTFIEAKNEPKKRAIGRDVLCFSFSSELEKDFCPYGTYKAKESLALFFAYSANHTQIKR